MYQPLYNETASLGLGVAKVLDPFDVGCRRIHKGAASGPLQVASAEIVRSSLAAVACGPRPGFAVLKDGLYNAAEKQTKSASVSQCEQISISISLMMPTKSGRGSELSSLGHINQEPIPPTQVPLPTLL